MAALRPPRVRVRPNAAGRLAVALVAAFFAAPASPGRAAGPVPVNVTPPMITGVLMSGQTLTEVNGTWMPSPTSFAYQWIRCPSGANCTAIPGATGQTYTLTDQDVGALIQVSEVASNANGSGILVVSALTGVVAPPPPPTLTSPPTISGSALDGQTLTEVHGGWTAAPSSYSLQWVDCDATGGACTPIAGATGMTYVVASNDIGHTIRVFEVAVNAGGPSAPAASAPTALVVASPPRNTVGPTVSGVGQVGSTLTCQTGTWSGTPPITFSYQWREDGIPIAGATDPSHALAGGDVALAVDCLVTARNVAGSASTQSDAVNVTAVIRAAGGGACSGLRGAALSRCRALQAYNLARTRCGSISATTKAGRTRRAACQAKARLTYRRALAVVKCQSIKSARSRATCVARARQLR